MKTLTRTGMVLLMLTATAWGQSASLYTTTEAQPLPDVRGRTYNGALEHTSYSSVSLPQARQFAIHDLITIIIREQSSATSESTLETEKSNTVDGGIDSFPHFDLGELLQGRLRNTDSPDNLPQVGVDFQNDFEGEAEYERTDTLTTRLTARVIDVKPNGTLSVEARTFIQNDDEKLEIAVTGQCRPEDITPDNSILSTQLYDLRVRKVHEGELRRTAKKGVLTKLLELVFNF